MCALYLLLCVVFGIVNLAQSQPPSLPLYSSSTVVPHSENAVEHETCPATLERDTALSVTLSSIEKLLKQVPSIISPPSTCAEVAESANFTPGYYWIKNATGATVQLFCGDGGGTRVAYLNTADTTEFSECPSPWLYADPSGRHLHTCRSQSGCESVFYSTNGMAYNKICGRIKGYQYVGANAFLAYYQNNALTIDDAYFNGVVLTHGPIGSRQHIWSWVVAASEHHPNNTANCKCITANNPSPADSPPWVGNDYFCETASPSHQNNGFYWEDPLWDGHRCGVITTNTCCRFPGAANNDIVPPTFCKELPYNATDDLEVRICKLGAAVELIELYAELM